MAPRKGQFQKGQSGNPRGRPAGARHKVTLALEALLDGEAQTITRKAIEMAKKGDPMMIRLCLERMLPVRRDRPVTFELPELRTSQDAAKAALAILQATGTGELTPCEAAELSKTVANYAETVRVCEIEQRLAEMERTAEGKQ